MHTHDSNIHTKDNTGNDYHYSYFTYAQKKSQTSQFTGGSHFHIFPDTIFFTLVTLKQTISLYIIVHDVNSKIL